MPGRVDDGRFQTHRSVIQPNDGLARGVSRRQPHQLPLYNRGSPPSTKGVANTLRQVQQATLHVDGLRTTRRECEN